MTWQVTRSSETFKICHNNLNARCGETQIQDTVLIPTPRKSRHFSKQTNCRQGVNSMNPTATAAHTWRDTGHVGPRPRARQSPQGHKRTWPSRKYRDRSCKLRPDPLGVILKTHQRANGRWASERPLTPSTRLHGAGAVWVPRAHGESPASILAAASRWRTWRPDVRGSPACPPVGRATAPAADGGSARGWPRRGCRYGPDRASSRVLGYLPAYSDLARRRTASPRAAGPDVVGGVDEILPGFACSGICSRI